MRTKAERKKKAKIKKGQYFDSLEETLTKLYANKEPKRLKVLLKGDSVLLYLEVNKYNDMFLYYKQKGKCFYCGKDMTNRKTNGNIEDGYNHDHFFPKCLGNSLKGNKILCHIYCNECKKDNQPSDEDIERYIKLYEAKKVMM